MLVNGEPAENLNVAFHPLGGDKNLFCPVGRTNNKGIFHLMTRSGADGAPAGEYRVTLVWPDGLIDECECPDPSFMIGSKVYMPKQISRHFKSGSAPRAIRFGSTRGGRIHDRLP